MATFASAPANRRFLVLSILAAAVCGSPATAEDPGPGEAAVMLEKIEITGSRIKRIDIEGLAPVVTIRREQIDRLGYTSVKDILGNLTTNTGGTFDTGQTFRAANGTQSIDLRGFGAGRTLILLDGRRLPVFPQGLDGTDAFVDLSTIPSSLIDRIEILLDGASAIHGSDAISGVINIVTRKDVNGTHAIARVFGTDDGGGSSQRYQFLHGLSAPAGSLQLVGEYTRQSDLRFTDRDYSDSDLNHGGQPSFVGNTFIGNDDAVIADPHCGTVDDAIGGHGIPSPDGVCRFDRSKFRQWMPDSEKGSLYLRADRKLGAFDAFARLGYYRGRLKSRAEAEPYVGGESGAFTTHRIIPDSAFDPQFGGGYVAPGAPNNPTTGTGDEQGGFFFRRLTEFGPRGVDLTTESYNALVGIGGDVKAFSRSYSWEVGVSHNDVRLRTRSPTILSSVFDNEVSNNGLELFEPIPDAIVASTRHTKAESGRSRNTTLDGTLTGSVGLVLPGGDVQVALHADVVREKYADEFDPITTAGDVIDSGSGGGGERDYLGSGFELGFPIRSNLDLDIAGRLVRYDDDSDVGSAFSPSVRIGYRPTPTVLMRASWGRSFRAPDLQRLFGATTNAFEIVVDTPRCVQNPDDPCGEIFGVPVQYVGSNPSLNEERSENVNFGLVIEPRKDLNLRVDVYHVEVDDLVSDLSAQQILDQCAASGNFCEDIRRDPDTGLLGTPLNGGSREALISVRAFNLATQALDGIDSAMSYRIDSPRLGRFDAELAWSHLMHLKVRSLPGDDRVEQLGFGQTVLVPKNRYAATLDWTQGRFGATVRIDRVGRYPGSNGLIEPARDDQFVDPYTTVNLQWRVDFGKAGRLRVGIDNVFDEDFPLDPTFEPGSSNVSNQFVASTTAYYASPLGRAGYLQYELAFD